MFDLLTTGQRKGRPGVAVEEEPKGLRQELGIRCIASVDRDVQDGGARSPREAADAPFLARRRGDRRGRNVEVLQKGQDLGHGRQSDRRTEDQADGGGTPPPEGEAGEDGDRHAGSVHDARDGGQDERGLR